MSTCETPSSLTRRQRRGITACTLTLAYFGRRFRSPAQNFVYRSAKQALWWTGREAAINKRAWLSHLGQPGCGRQSGQSDRQHGDGEERSSSTGPGDVGPGETSECVSQVGILGCHCHSCLTEGDDHGPLPPGTQKAVDYAGATSAPGPRLAHGWHQQLGLAHGVRLRSPPLGGNPVYDVDVDLDIHAASCSWD